MHSRLLALSRRFFGRGPTPGGGSVWGERAFSFALFLIAFGPSLGFMAWALAEGAGIPTAVGLGLLVLPFYALSGVWLLAIGAFFLIRWGLLRVYRSRSAGDRKTARDLVA